MTRVDQSADGTTVDLPRGGELEVALAENPTTGYRWQLTRDPSPLCRPLADTLLPGTTPGQPGRRVWRWQAVQPGETALTLSLVRSWRDQATRTFNLHIKIT